MKRSSIALIVATFVLAVWWFHVPATPMMAGPRDSNQSVESIITQLERNGAAAIVMTDTGALERLLAKEFNGTIAAMAATFSHA